MQIQTKNIRQIPQLLQKTVFLQLIASVRSADLDMFTDRDEEVGYDESSAVMVAFHPQVQPQAQQRFCQRK